MKVMWISMSAIGNASNIFYGKNTQSGGWIDATYERLLPYIKSKQLDLHIVVLGDTEKSVYEEDSSVTYHMVKIKRRRGKSGTLKDVLLWKNP